MFGEGNSGAAVRVTMRDERCVMVNLDPDTAERDSEAMKTVVRMNENYAGVYGTVVRAGELRVGPVVTLRGHGEAHQRCLLHVIAPYFGLGLHKAIPSIDIFPGTTILCACLS